MLGTNGQLAQVPLRFCQTYISTCTAVRLLLARTQFMTLLLEYRRPAFQVYACIFNAVQLRRRRQHLWRARQSQKRR
jgi:hypothetical protein